MSPKVFPKLGLDTELEQVSPKERLQHLRLLWALLDWEQSRRQSLAPLVLLLLGRCSLRTGALCSQGGASLKARKLPPAL